MNKAFFKAFEGDPCDWLPSFAGDYVIKGVLLVLETSWETNKPQDTSDNIIYIIACEHLHRKQWLPAFRTPSPTCHRYERPPFDIQWVKGDNFRLPTVLPHTGCVVNARGHLIGREVSFLARVSAGPSLRTCVPGASSLTWVTWQPLSLSLCPPRSVISWFNWLK